MTITIYLSTAPEKVAPELTLPALEPESGGSSRMPGPLQQQRPPSLSVINTRYCRRYGRTCEFAAIK